MSTFVAIVLGTVLGGELFEAWQGAPWLTGGLLTAIALVGTAASYRHSPDGARENRRAHVPQSSE